MIFPFLFVFVLLAAAVCVAHQPTKIPRGSSSSSTRKIAEQPHILRLVFVLFCFPFFGHGKEQCDGRIRADFWKERKRLLLFWLQVYNLRCAWIVYVILSRLHNHHTRFDSSSSCFLFVIFPCFFGVVLYIYTSRPCQNGILMTIMEVWPVGTSATQFKASEIKPEKGRWESHSIMSCLA